MNCVVKIPRRFFQTVLCSLQQYCIIIVYKEISLLRKECGTKHDRDVNAAINIREEGKRIFMEYAANEITKQDKSKKRAETKSQNRKNKKQKSSKTSEPGGTPEIDCFTSSGN